MKKNLDINAEYLENVINNSTLRDQKAEIYRLLRIFSTLTFHEQERFVTNYLSIPGPIRMPEVKKEISAAVKEVMRLTKATDSIPVFDPRAFGSIGYKPTFNNKKY